MHFHLLLCLFALHCNHKLFSRRQICIALSDGATRVLHDEHKTPYAYEGDRWIGYDDEESFQIKVYILI